ncbi:MAG: helix-turn-helix domain-containing protein [Candidatus Magasanikbacteria bacterium]|nr:helix-turn-helix domain-containing protein [Candidatus Magasanikbacteria bacterium]
MDISFFKKLGFSDKDAMVYMALLALGPSSVRNLAKKVELNRGTVYEILKSLKEQKLVTYYEKEAKQFFVAEDPIKLEELLARQEGELNDVKSKLKGVVSELKAVYDKGGARPVARYYEKGEIKKILEHVLDICEVTEETQYRVYSDSNITEYLYEGFQSFSDARVAKGIAVKAIASGSGGALRGLDERKFFTVKSQKPTYILIYPGHTAYISLDSANELVGVVIENDGIFEMQKSIFDELWKNL